MLVNMSQLSTTCHGFSSFCLTLPNHLHIRIHAIFLTLLQQLCHSSESCGKHTLASCMHMMSN